MSEPRRRPMRDRATVAVCVLIALAFGSAASTAAAQSVEEYRANVERLKRAVADAQVALEASEAARRAALPTRTVRASGFVILTTPDLESLARDAAMLAEHELRATLGSLYAEVAARPIVLRVPGAVQLETRVMAAARMRSVQLAGLGADGLPIEPWAADVRDAERVAKNMVRMAIRGVFDRMPHEIRTWLGVPFWPLPATTNSFGGTYIDLVTQPSQSVRACFTGSHAQCADALELGTIADPMMTWYNTDERRLLVLRIRRSMPVQSKRDARFGLCIDQQAYDVCDELLRSRLGQPSSENTGTPVPPPLGHAARNSLLHVALQLGGDDAFRRLVDDGAPSGVDARLSAAAGVSHDSLLSAWRSSVISSRPSPVTLTARIAWTALIWSLFAGALALRSTRWR